ncbi:MAG: antibiotic biosynthesis monooxygenase [Ectothiorhodospiraceae bacterium]|jgi:heme-degrading monooxygenase HmoA|nr:antibiotic biosynthesis monooxygenase [Ectothiorhodospiraceae bacterium]
MTSDPHPASDQPPCYAVIFTSKRSEGDNGYADMAQEILELARIQPGFLGFESARNDIGISVSYWDSLDAIRAWKENARHLEAQSHVGDWYDWYRVRICQVLREYGAGQVTEAP